MSIYWIFGLGAERGIGGEDQVLEAARLAGSDIEEAD